MTKPLLNRGVFFYDKLMKHQVSLENDNIISYNHIIR
jgi:hypothetical protein